MNNGTDRQISGLSFLKQTILDRSQLNEPELRSHLAYWSSQLGGELPVLELPTDRPRSA